MAEAAIGAIVAELKLNSTKFARGINKANKNIGSLKKSVKSMSTSIIALAGAGGLGLLAREAIKTMAKFEQSMANVQAVLGGTKSEMESLTQAARDMGATTAFSASEAAEGMEFLGRAGFSTNEIMETIGPTLNLAAAGSIELGEAADIASNILSGFGLKADQLTRVVDVMAKTTSSANTDTRQLGDAMKFVAPVAAGFGVSVEETSAAIGILSNAGLQATVAGTGLRKILTVLATPTKALKDRMGGLSVESDGLTNVLKKLSRSGISTSESMEIFGDRAGPAFNVLVNATGQVESLNDSLLKAGGTAEEMAKVKLDTLQGSFRLFKSALEGLTLAAGDKGFAGAVRAGIDAMRDFVSEINQTDAILNKLSSAAPRSVFFQLNEQLKELKTEREGLLEFLDSAQGKMQTFQGIETPLGSLNFQIEALEQIIANVEKTIVEETKLTATLKKQEQERAAAAKKALEDAKKVLVEKKKFFEAVKQGILDEQKKSPTRQSDGSFFGATGGFFSAEIEGEFEQSRLRLEDIGDQQVKDFEAHGEKIKQVQAKILGQTKTAKQKEFDLFVESLEKLRRVNQISVGDTLDLSPFSRSQEGSLKAIKAVKLGLIDLDAIVKSFVPTISTTNEQIEALGFFRDPVDEAAQRMADLAIAIEKVGKQTGKTQEQIDEALARLTSRFDETNQQMFNFGQSVRSILEGGLTEAFQGAINGAETFRESFINILLAIQKEIIRTFIVGQLLKAIGQGIGGDFGAGVSGGGKNAFNDFGPGAFSIDGLASGGPANAGNAFVVGEEGPELFVPRTSGTVVPNDELGGGSNITLQVTTGVQQTVQAEMIRLMPKIQETVKSGIADARMRGGKFSRAMGV